MCGSKGGGSPPVPSAASTAFQSTVSPSPFAASLYTDFLNRANAASTTPFNPAMMGTVAPMNPTQFGAGGQLYNLGIEAGNFGQTVGNFDANAVRAIESPYIQDVVGATQGWFNNQNAIQSQDLLSNAIRSGNAFGGDRAGVAEGILAGQQQLAQAPVIAGLYQSGYGQALQEYNTLKNLGLQGRQLGLQGAGAALGWGSMQQQQQQREFDVAQQNAMMQSAYPFQTLNWYGSILGGIAPLTGSQAVGYNTPPDPNSASSALGLASAGLGFAGALGGAAGPGQKYGGTVRRARGGLVPVLVRHNGGLVAGLAYGGSFDSDDSEDSRDSNEDRPSESKTESYSTRPPETTATDAGGSWGRNIGQLKSPARQLPQPVFPSGSGTTQPQQKSEAEGWINLATKAVPLVKMAAAPFTGGLSMLAPFQRGGWVIPRLADGGDPEDSSWTDGTGDEAGEPEGSDGFEGSETEVDTGPVPLPRARPNPPIPMSPPTSGRMTWFNPRPYTYTDPNTGTSWTDTGARGLREGPHASGLPLSTPGFATAGRRGLGHWYEVTTPDGQKQIIQKTDIGPPGVIDLNAAAASRAYPRGPSSVPSGQASVRYIGAQLPPDVKPTTAPASAAGGPQGQGLVDPDADATQGGGGGGRGGGYSRTQLPPELAGPPKTFAQRWASNPFTQLGAGLLAGRSPYFGVNLGNAMLGTIKAQEEGRRHDVLDAKPQMIETDQGMGFRVGDQFFQTGLRSRGAAQQEWERKTQKPFATEEEVPGPFGSTQKVKKYWTYDEDGNVVPFQQPQSAAPTTRQEVVTPPDDEETPAPAPAAPTQPTPQQQAPQPAPGQPQQQQQQAPSAPSVQRPPPRQTQAPGSPPVVAEPQQQQAPAAPPGGRTGGAQVPQVAQGAPSQGPAMAGPYSFEEAWRSVKPAGTVTDPQGAVAGRNEAALQGLSPQEQRIIKGIADYTIDPSKVFTGKKGSEMRPYAIQKVQEYDPSYNAANYPARAQALKEYGVNGQAQKSLQSNTMVLEHIGDAMTATDKLENSTIPIYNKLTGQWLYQTGDPKYQAAFKSFQTATEAAATEAAKTFRGVGAMSQREQELWNNIVGNVYDSPVGLRAALKELTGLVQGRLNATANGYNQAMGPRYYRDGESWMTPKAVETINRARTTVPERNQPFPPSRFGETKGSGPGGQQGEAPQQQQGGGGSWQRDPNTGNYRGPDGRIYDPNGKPLQ